MLPRSEVVRSQLNEQIQHTYVVLAALEKVEIEMKLDREPLIKALDQVKPALQSSGSIPALKHIWLDGKYLYAYNGALGIRIDWVTELEPCGILGSVLAGLLQNTSAKEIDLTQSNMQIDLKMGRASASVPVMNIEQNPWPFPAKVTGSGVLSLTLTEELVTGLKRVRAVKAANPVRVEHYGVIVFPSKDEYMLYTTDSKALAEVPVKGKLSKDLSRAVLPHGFVSQLLSLKAGAKISFLADSIIAESADIQVCSNLLDSADVFDLPDLVDKTIGGEIKRTPLPEGFGEALDRALVLAGSDLDKAFITLTVSKKELTLVGKLVHGMLLEKFPLKSTGEGKITVGLEHVKTLSKEAEEFAIVQKALLLFGKDDSLFMIATHEEAK